MGCHTSKQMQTQIIEHNGIDLLRSLQEFKLQLDNRAFVFIPGGYVYRLLLHFGAEEPDLVNMEKGLFHAACPRDPEEAMAFRQIGFQRMLLSFPGDATFDWTNEMPPRANVESGNWNAITQIAESEIASSTADGAQVAFKRSGTRMWPLPPREYSKCSIPKALALLNQQFLPDLKDFHPQKNVNNDSDTVINDQVIIRITKKTESVESPTPEGIHQDGTEISSVMMVNRRFVTGGGESRIWTLDTPIGNYPDQAMEETDVSQTFNNNGGYIATGQCCLFNLSLTSPWDTLYFNDRRVKHEARGFDGARPCVRDVIVNFLRKPLKDGSDRKLVPIQ